MSMPRTSVVPAAEVHVIANLSSSSTTVLVIPIVDVIEFGKLSWET